MTAKPTYEQLEKKIKAFEDDAATHLNNSNSLKQSEELFRALFEQAGGYCMVLQPTDCGIPVIIDVNKAACVAHGFTRSEMIGKPIVDLDDEEGKKLCLERTQKIMSGKTLVTETNHVRKDGSTFPVSIYANLIQIDDNPPLILTTEHDISEIREERNKVLEKEKEKRIIFMATVSSTQHILNNLLNSLLLFKLKAEKADFFDDKTKAQYEQVIREGTELVKKLSSVEVLTESNIKASVYPKSD